jgi:Protein of unknown function (DUF4245)
MVDMARRRGQETIRDMVLSLTVVLVGVLLFAAFMPRGGTAVKVVDAAGPVDQFARHAPYETMAPRGLPTYWKPTSVRVVSPGSSPVGADVAELSIGYVVDRGPRTFARLDETNAPDGIDRLLGERPTVRTVVIDGQSWDSRPDADGHNALSRTVDGATVIVSDGAGKGGASMAALSALAALLVLVRSAVAS